MGDLITGKSHDPLGDGLNVRWNPRESESFILFQNSNLLRLAENWLKDSGMPVSSADNFALWRLAQKKARCRTSIVAKGLRRCTTQVPTKARNAGGFRNGVHMVHGSETIVKTSIWPTSQEDIRHYRALGSICRQQAVLHPEASWVWLSQAERWEDLAAAAPAQSDSRHDDVPVQEAA